MTSAGTLVVATTEGFVAGQITQRRANRWGPLATFLVAAVFTALLHILAFGLASEVLLGARHLSCLGPATARLKNTSRFVSCYLLACYYESFLEGRDG